MYNNYKSYFSYPYYLNTQRFYSQNMNLDYSIHSYRNTVNMSMYDQDIEEEYTMFMDYGPEPYVVDMEEITKENNTFRTALWTGDYLQLTLMSIDVGDDIGLEVHHDHDQFLRIEEGQGIVQMGDTEDQLDYEERVYDDFAVFVPAGKWHNLTNTGNTPLKLYSIYAPPEHPHGTVHETKADDDH
ncbi:mannose-6-phosphate isomerase-like protein (cupin superfamily) [Natranaerovirga pectinivora]|uniref:Mannose-6-phosphate isomerase-like protein (Cupin superfamily) n=1 Tax=Natranaerovirga pectinivora TaxID=682400 RepID=A0A4R3MSR6_9FIRM|nr:cupin domain-containing protein [Natranaerovirga pectinivora]TCT16064.1 mannose-6-phosphate isomerase-like protein (cupin superfamily) [Natranaerovirga pectinivora]